VYKNAKKHSSAERSRVFALGRYEGLKEALRLIDRQGQNESRASSAGKARHLLSPLALPPFSAIFQKLRPKHGPTALGRW